MRTDSPPRAPTAPRADASSRRDASPRPRSLLLVAIAALALASCDSDEAHDRIGLRDVPTFDADGDVGSDDAGGDDEGGASDSGGSDAAELDGADATDPDDDDTREAGSDAADDAANPDAADVSVPCPEPVDAFTGVLVEDLDGSTLEVGDRVRVTVGVHAGSSAETPIRLVLEHGNLDSEPASARLDGGAVAVDAPGDRWTIDLAATRDATLVYEATVRTSTELVVVNARLSQDGNRCEVPRSRSGALFQIAGGESKTPRCVDMASFRSVQVAPHVPLQDTAAYRAANGAREDLLADGFIFCPENPTIVHTAEFCLTRASERGVAFAGSYLADASWEVDDFVLVEVLVGGAPHADGFTTQHHGGGSTFWCDAESRLMCETPCTAELVEVATDRRIAAIADADAQGATPRQHLDGTVEITPLLPPPATAADVRVTALDVGVEGTLRPALYLVGLDL